MRPIDKKTFISTMERLKEEYGSLPTHNTYEDGLKEGRLLGYIDAIDKANSLTTHGEEDIVEEKILDFRDEYSDYTPANYPPKENGYYMTIRCGLGGIYTKIDEWKDGHWMVGITDGSYVIAYTKNTIPKEKVNKWCKAKLSKLWKKGNR